VSNCMCDHGNPERGPMFQLGTHRKIMKAQCGLQLHRKKFNSSKVKGICLKFYIYLAFVILYILFNEGSIQNGSLLHTNII
jgi:hypothetical protein